MLLSDRKFDFDKEHYWYFAQNGTFSHLLDALFVGELKRTIINGIYKNVKERQYNRSQASIVLASVQSALSVLKSRRESGMITKEAMNHELAFLANPGNPIYDSSGYAGSGQVTQVSYGGAWQNNGAFQAGLANAVYSKLPPIEQNATYARVSADNLGIPGLDYDPTGHSKYSERVGVNARISGFDFMAGDGGTSQTLIFATLAARLDFAAAERRKFHALFDNPSDVFAVRFLGALYALYKSNPEGCARYVGGVAINGAPVDLRYLVATGNPQTTWEQTKVAISRAKAAAPNIAIAKGRANVKVA